MARKNPDNKPLRLVFNRENPHGPHGGSPQDREFGLVLSNLALAESNLVRAGKDSAMPHFLACVKALEKHYGFHFEIAEPEPAAAVALTARYVCPQCSTMYRVSINQPPPLCPNCGEKAPPMELDL